MGKSTDRCMCGWERDSLRHNTVQECTDSGVSCCEPEFHHEFKRARTKSEKALRKALRILKADPDMLATIVEDALDYARDSDNGADSGYVAELLRLSNLLARS